MTNKLDMAGFADRDELKQYVHRDGAFYLGGIHGDHRLRGEAGIADDRHLFVVAGSRAGKGTSLIIPNLIRWPGSLFCIDPKGENASICGLRRASADDAKGTGTSVRDFIGQKVGILDPFKIVRGPARAFRVHFDPLADIDITTETATSEIESLVDAIVIADKGEQHFSESAGTILAGTIEAVLVREPREKQTLLHCRELILSGFDKLETLLQSVKTPSGLAQDALSLLQDTGDDERGSFRSTLSRQLRWMADPRMQEHLKPKGFSLADAVRGNWSVFVVIPPALIPRMKRWLRLIVRLAFEAKMQSAFEHEGHQTLFLLDEFPALGHFQIIEEAAGYMAGYGIKLVPIIQNIGQIKQHYGQNWETFLGNAGAIIAWGLNDHETETYIADRIGKILVWEEGYSTSGKTGGLARESESESLSIRERPIRWPSEIHAQGARQHMRGFVVPASGAAFTIERKPYMNEIEQKVFDSPDFIKEWEARHAKRP